MTKPTRKPFGFSALGMVLVLTGCHAADAGPGETAAAELVPVLTTKTSWQAMARPVKAVGRTAYSSDLRLAFKTGGVIARIDVDEGARVKKGQVLASLDLREISAATEQSKTALAKAERDWARLSALEADRVVPTSILQDATSALDVARAGNQAAEFNRTTSVIRAPADGVVLVRMAEPGEVVAPGMPVLVVGTQTQTTVARVAVAEKEARTLRVGDTVSLSLGGDAAPVSGQITKLAPALSPQTGTVETEVSFTAAQTFPAGTMVRATLKPSTASNVCMLPVSALFDGEKDRAQVWVLAPGQATPSKREVRVGWFEDGRVALTQGPTEGDMVVAEGAPYLDETSRVKIVGAFEPAAQTKVVP